MKSTSKIIKEGSDEYKRWDPPGVTGSLGANGLLTAQQLSGIQDQAYQEAREQGFETGYQEGLGAGKKHLAARERENQEKAELLGRLLTQMCLPFEQLDQQVEQELVALAMAIAHQIIRREIKTDPGQIIAVVREALAFLPVASRNIRLYLHPEDVVLVRDSLALQDDNQQWQLVEDPVLKKGDCRVVTETSQIDASVENRLAMIFAQILGGEREQDATDSRTTSR